MSEIQEPKTERPPRHTDAVNSEKPVLVAHQKKSHETDSGSIDEAPVHLDAQAGVQKIEAITSAWTTTSLVVAYVMIWVNFFVVQMQQGTLANLTPFVTSAFTEHSLTATISVVSSIILAVSSLTLAKILDVFGRPQGYLASVIVTTVGLVMLAACNGVEEVCYSDALSFIKRTSFGHKAVSAEEKNQSSTAGASTQIHSGDEHSLTTRGDSTQPLRSSTASASPVSSSPLTSSSPTCRRCATGV